MPLFQQVIRKKRKRINKTGADDNKTCKNMESSCDIICESEKISDLGSAVSQSGNKIEEVSDRRNLAEIKI